MKEEGGLLVVWANKCETVSSRRTLTENSSVCVKMRWAQLEWQHREEEQTSAPQKNLSLSFQVELVKQDGPEQSFNRNSQKEKHWMMNNWLSFLNTESTFHHDTHVCMWNRPGLTLSFFSLVSFLSLHAFCLSAAAVANLNLSHLTPWSWTTPPRQAGFQPCGPVAVMSPFPLCLQAWATASPSFPLSPSSLSISPNDELSSPLLLHLENPSPSLHLHLVSVEFTGWKCVLLE